MPSLPPTRANAPASPLSMFADWNFMIHYVTCATLRQLAVAERVQARGSAVLAAEVVRRLRCPRCE